MNKTTKTVVIGIVVTVVGGLILNFIPKSCTPPCEEETEKLVYGRVTDNCEGKPIIGVKPNIDAHNIVKKSNSDNSGKFELLIKGCGKERLKIFLDKNGFETYEQLLEIDFSSEKPRNIGDVELVKKKDAQTATK